MTTLVTGNTHSPVEQTSAFVSTGCSEGDTLLPGDEPGFGFTCANGRELIAELRRTVAAAEEALDADSGGRE
jgi:hypothetical protein